MSSFLYLCMAMRKFLLVIVLCITATVGWFVWSVISDTRCSLPGGNYIAHAGGVIEGYAYTNSKEAVEHSIECGIRHIELDLKLTSDSFVVAAHSWREFNEMCGNKDLDHIPTLAEFGKMRIHGKFTPLTYMDIDSLMAAHPDVVLVADKLCIPKVIDRFLGKYRDRVMVECFDIYAYYYFMDHGYLMSMYASPKAERLEMYLRRWLHLKRSRYDAAVLYKGNEAMYPLCGCKLVYTARDRQEADSIFSHDSDVKFVYIDNVE